MKTSIRLPAICRFCTIATTAVLCTVFAARAASPVKITPEVATTVDLTAEIQALLTTIEERVASAESYNDYREQLKRQALQIAILSQALAEHESESPLKKSAPSLRNAALTLSRTMSHEDAVQVLPRLKDARDGKLTGTPAIDAEWEKLARASTLMHAMKERSESIRRALRRPKDPEVESRNATAIALMILAVHGDTHAVKNPADKGVWQSTCIELQGHMSHAAAAIKARDSSAADHFRMGMEACDRCHQKFKP